MKTAVLINSRGNANKLTMTLHALAGLASRPDDLRFCIRVDSDDKASRTQLKRLSAELPVKVFTGPRPQSMGAEINRMAQAVDADFYTVLNDDVMPLTVNWDVAAAARYSEEKAFVSCWSMAPGPTAPDYPVISRDWFNAAGRKIFTDMFAFWFDDVDLSNRYLLVTNKLMVQLPCQLRAKKTKTARMRDFAFWWTLYRAMEPERLAWAQQTAYNLGLTVDIRRDHAEMVKRCHAHDGEWFHNKMQIGIEARLGDKSEPDPGYLAIRERAKKLIVSRAPYLETLKQAA